MRAVLGVVVLGGLAAAEPTLQLDHEPPHLRMRPRAAAVTKPVRPPPAPIVRAPAPPASDYAEDLGAVRDLRQPISFSINVGYQVEAARPSGNASLGLKSPVDNSDYAALRSYGFAEGFVSTRGVGVESLSTYLSVRAEAARQLEAPGTGNPIPPPISTWFERSGSDVRTGWAELKDFLPAGWGMANLRVRAGDQFVYGPWVVHVDGLLVAWDGKLLSGSLYTGVRHSDYTRDQPEDRPSVAGGSARLDLRGLSDSIPLALVADYLHLGVNDSGGQPSSSSTQLEADWRPRRDFAFIGSWRALDGDTASVHAQFRGRYKQVSNLVADYTRRYKDDWRWDPSLIVPETDPTQARRYLDLGPVQPQSITSVRAGTLIAENIDLFARGAIARDLSGPTDVKSSFNASYVEAAGAFELRLRRTVAIGGSVLSRQTDRQTLDPIIDFRIPGSPQALPNSAQLGETGFTEIGTSVRMSLGARRFSAMVEVYARNTRYAPVYVDAITPVPYNDLRGGGRFTVDAWIGQHIRLFAAYDLSSALDFAPEITGYKSLRLMMSGVY